MGKTKQRTSFKRTSKVQKAKSGTARRGRQITDAAHRKNPFRRIQDQQARKGNTQAALRGILEAKLNAIDAARTGE
jgi:hypothetical protein